jgi:hypothetical protein
VNAAPVLNERGPELPNFWTVDPTQYEYSMTLVGMLAHSGIDTTLAGHEIGVFAGNELRGSAKAIYLDRLDMHLFFLTMYANTAGELLHFKLYDAATGQVTNLTETMYFTAGLHQGSVQSPVPFGYQSTTGCDRGNQRAVAAGVAQPVHRRHDDPLHAHVRTARPRADHRHGRPYRAG